MSRKLWNFPYPPVFTHAQPPHYQHNGIPLYGTHDGVYQRHFKNIPHPRVVHWIYFLNFVVFTSLKFSNLKTTLRLLGHPLFSKAIWIFLHKAITGENLGNEVNEGKISFLHDSIFHSGVKRRELKLFLFIEKTSKLVGIESKQRAGEVQEQWNKQELFMAVWI